MTLVLTSGGIDISIGSIIGLTATIMGILMIDQGMPAVVAIVVAVLVGALCGAFNGFLVAVVEVPPIIVRLGTLTFFCGLAGIDTNRIKFVNYTIMGVLASIGGMVWVAPVNSVQAAIAYGVEFPTIALVVLGGTSLFGGRGLVIGSLMGALILAIPENGLVLVGLSSFVQQVLLGLIFSTVVAFRTLQFREGQVTCQAAYDGTARARGRSAKGSPARYRFIHQDKERLSHGQAHHVHRRQRQGRQTRRSGPGRARLRGLEPRHDPAR